MLPPAKTKGLVDLVSPGEKLDAFCRQLQKTTPLLLGWPPILAYKFVVQLVASIYITFLKKLLDSLSNLLKPVGK